MEPQHAHFLLEARLSELAARQQVEAIGTPAEVSAWQAAQDGYHSVMAYASDALTEPDRVVTRAELAEVLMAVVSWLLDQHRYNAMRALHLLEDDLGWKRATTHRLDAIEALRQADAEVTDGMLVTSAPDAANTAISETSGPTF